MLMWMLVNAHRCVYLHSLPVTSVLLYYMCIPDSVVYEEVSLFCRWWRPGVECVCCKPASAGVRPHT